MAAMMGFQPRVSVETTLGSQRSFLALTISVFPCFPSDSGSGFATLYEQTLCLFSLSILIAPRFNGI